MQSIVIIGAGECGVRAAFELRAKGFAGSVTLVNGEARQPYERPPLSKALNVKVIQIRPSETFAEANIELINGAIAVDIDRSKKVVELSNEITLNYDKMLVATGARARVFPGMETCFTLRTDADAARIMQKLRDGARVGIIGGGFIGLELAATASQVGAKVTVVESAPRVLQRAVPQQLADIVCRRHMDAGVNIVTKTDVAAANATRIALSDGTKLEFDMVITGVGSIPNTELAGKVGLEINNGIEVDPAFQTSDPDIFAAGDCCSFKWSGAQVRLESWKSAQDQGAYVAASMLGEEATYTAVPWFWSDQYELTLQVAGLFNLEKPVVERVMPENLRLVFQCDAQGRVVAAAGIGPGQTIAKHISIFEKLIARQAAHDLAVLCDPDQNLKRLLRAA